MQQKFLIDPKQKQLFLLVGINSVFSFFLGMSVAYAPCVEASELQEEEIVMMMGLTMPRFHNWKLPCQRRFLSETFLSLIVLYSLGGPTKSILVCLLQQGQTSHASSCSYSSGRVNCSCGLSALPWHVTSVQFFFVSIFFGRFSILVVPVLWCSQNKKTHWQDTFWRTDFGGKVESIQVFHGHLVHWWWFC